MAGHLESEARIGAPLTVGVVVVNWRREDLTVRCLESLTALDQSHARISIVVVDNAGSRALPEAMGARFPQVQVIQNSTNAGYAAALNQGAARHGAACDFLWFMNNDVQVEPDTLSALLAAMASDPGIGVVGPLVYHPVARARLEQAGFRVSHWTGRHQYLKPGKDLFSDPAVGIEDVDSAYGCANIVRRETFERLGGFDSRFNIYFEETDFNVRVRRLGQRVVVVRRARVLHREGGTMNHYIVRRAFYLLKNLVLFQWKHASGVQLAFFVPYFLVIHLPYFVLRGSVYAIQVQLKSAIVQSAP
jgi:GT2 family glycosyltransferase